jgi:hypothetical protein
MAVPDFQTLVLPVLLADQCGGQTHSFMTGSGEP